MVTQWWLSLGPTDESLCICSIMNHQDLLEKWPLIDKSVAQGGLQIDRNRNLWLYHFNNIIIVTLRGCMFLRKDWLHDHYSPYVLISAYFQGPWYRWNRAKANFSAHCPLLAERSSVKQCRPRDWSKTAWCIDQVWAELLVITPGAIDTDSIVLLIILKV